MSKAEEFLAKLNALLKEYEAGIYLDPYLGDAFITIGEVNYDVEETDDGFSFVTPQIITTPEPEPQGRYELQATCDGEHWFTLYRVSGDYPGCETYTVVETSGTWGPYQQCRVAYIPAKDVATRA